MCRASRPSFSGCLSLLVYMYRMLRNSQSESTPGISSEPHSVLRGRRAGRSHLSLERGARVPRASVPCPGPPGPLGWELWPRLVFWQLTGLMPLEQACPQRQRFLGLQEILSFSLVLLRDLGFGLC